MKKVQSTCNFCALACNMDFYVEDDKIILKKYAPTDIFTGDREDLIEYHGKMVSKKSIEELAKLANLI